MSCKSGIFYLNFDRRWNFIFESSKCNKRCSDLMLNHVYGQFESNTQTLNKPANIFHHFNFFAFIYVRFNKAKLRHLHMAIHIESKETTSPLKRKAKKEKRTETEKCQKNLCLFPYCFYDYRVLCVLLILSVCMQFSLFFSIFSWFFFCFVVWYYLLNLLASVPMKRNEIPKTWRFLLSANELLWRDVKIEVK